MDSQEKQTRILIGMSLFLFSFIVFYNAFYIPQVKTPHVVYIDKDEATAANIAEFSDEYHPKSLVELNMSSAEEIEEKIPGVGPVMAQKIIQYREENGQFADISELKNISGIGEKKFEKIKNYVYIDEKGASH